MWYLLLLLLVGCAQQIDARFDELPPDACLPRGFDEYVIRTQDQYDELAKPLSCIAMDIDFSTHTLIGKYVRGCNAQFIRSVYTNDPERQLYYVIETSNSTCEQEISSMNWILVDRLPEKYAVQFVVR